jgi:hypothetical protein
MPLVRAMAYMNHPCPADHYVLHGFTQARSSPATTQRHRQRPRPGRPDLVLASADRRRRRHDGVARACRPIRGPIGAEITLHEVPMLSALGLA